MQKAIQLLLERLGLRKLAAVELTDEWLVELDGKPVALLFNPRDNDMFWFTWDIGPIGKEIPKDLWSYNNDARRTFRHRVNGYCDNCAFPATDDPIVEGDRVLIRGPLCRKPRK
ncbi:MAG: hypothetical protein ACYC6N_12615 [Pirellulaceae bacterium]